MWPGRLGVRRLRLGWSWGMRSRCRVPGRRVLPGAAEAVPVAVGWGVVLDGTSALFGEVGKVGEVGEVREDQRDRGEVDVAEAGGPFEDVADAAELPPRFALDPVVVATQRGLRFSQTVSPPLAQSRRWSRSPPPAGARQPGAMQWSIVVRTSRRNAAPAARRRGSSNRRIFGDVSLVCRSCSTGPQACSTAGSTVPVRSPATAPARRGRSRGTRAAGTRISTTASHEACRLSEQVGRAVVSPVWTK